MHCYLDQGFVKSIQVLSDILFIKMPYNFMISSYPWSPNLCPEAMVDCVGEPIHSMFMPDCPSAWL